MKEMIKRTCRTFVEAALGYIAANLVVTVSESRDTGVLRTAAVGLIMSSVAAGLAAILNLPRETEGKEGGKDGK